MSKTPTQEVIDILRASPHEGYRISAKGYKDCVKFRLPLNAEILDVADDVDLVKRYKPLIPIIKLPYDMIILEYDITTFDVNKHGKMVVAAREMEESIYFQIYIKPPNQQDWVLQNGLGGIKKNWNEFELFNVSNDPEQQEDPLEQLCAYNGARAILNLMAALGCKNVMLSEEVFKIKKRFGGKKSKPKQVGEIVYKTLIVDTDAINKENHQKAAGNGAVKKQHLRRGHIRHLKNKTIWVNACVVGDKGKGQVEKDYQVV